MLTPNTGRHVVLLPQDREIMSITGMDEDSIPVVLSSGDFAFQAQTGRANQLSDHSFFGQVSHRSCIELRGLCWHQSRNSKSKRNLNREKFKGQTLVNGSRFTPKAGFDSVQNVVELGSTIPLVYAKRQLIDGVAYGGVRVNTDLLWSQMYSVGGGQLLRAVFMVGEGQNRRD